MIDDETLLFFEENNLKSALEEIYSRVPSGMCSGSTNCCSESVNTFYSEFINMAKLLESKGMLDEFSERALRYYLTELVIPQKCPMLQDDGLCVMYDARPLPCRVFGHLPKDEYEANYDLVLKQNSDAVSELRREYDIVVPESVSHSKVAFCENFSGDSPFNINDRDDLVDSLFSLESQFLMEDLLDSDMFNLSLVQWFAYSIFGEEDAQELRIKVSQEISKSGHSETLEGIFSEDIDN